MYYKFIYLFLVFLMISFGGYVVEVINCSISQRKLVNRGFLFGPYLPIYGVGGVLLVLTLNKYQNDMFIVFVVGMVMTSCIEYYTSYILERIFHNKWWDYSMRKDSINGRICLKNCLLFGIGSCFIIKYLYPFIEYLLSFLSYKTTIILGTVLLIIFIIDCIASYAIAYNLRHRLIIAEELKSEKIKMLPVLIEKKYTKEISKLRFAKNRLIKAFPNIYNSNPKELDTIYNISKKVKQKKKASKKAKKKARK